MKTSAVKISILLLFLISGSSLNAQVTYDRMLHPDREPQNWLTYGGDYASHRYSQLAEINKENVNNLQLKWIHRFTTMKNAENTPLVVDGILYTGDTNQVEAIDAVTGRTYWTYSHTVDPKGVFVLPMFKGFAISGNKLFWATLDGHLIALDAKNGQLIWDKVIAVWQKGYQLNVAPLVVKDKVILGPATNEEGANCWIAAYDINTGNEIWRFNTVPEPGEANFGTWPGDSWKRGGAPIWVTGTYDPQTNLTYWGTGNPNPGWNGDPRSPGDNLYSDTVVALDTDTGKLKWHYQFTPNDEFDWDSVEVPVLVDLTWKGKPRKVMLFANRNGFFYVLDRTTGEFLNGTAFVKQNWNVGFDTKGRPTKAAGHVATYEGTFIRPGVQGGTNWYSPSYSPRTGLFYVSTWQNYSAYSAKKDQQWVEGQRYTGVGPGTAAHPKAVPPFFKTTEEGYGAVIALDPHTGEKKWEAKMTDYTDAGVLTTASDLAFSGGKEGNFFALDARTGDFLWKVNLGGMVASSPMTYSVNGHQYVAVCGGNALFVFGLPDKK
ncbi:MAG: PQQ-dependent dehydrogenase, methanol/ethanol family [Granulicella sp.]